MGLPLRLGHTGGTRLSGGFVHMCAYESTKFRGDGAVGVCGDPGESQSEFARDSDADVCPLQMGVRCLHL